MERPRYHNSPRTRRKAPIPTLQSLKKRAWAKFAVLVVLSPIVLPVFILISPYLLREAWRDRKNERAEQNRRALDKKTPPRPIDPELELRRELARRTNKRSDPRIPMLYDPINDDPVYAWAIKEAGQMAEEQMGEPYKMGDCHVFWRHKKQILREKFDITWYSPRDMNPSVRFD
jgi:hypothetical protein